MYVGTVAVIDANESWCTIHNDNRMKNDSFLSMSFCI